MWTPLLDKVIAKNLRFEIFTYQCSSPSRAAITAICVWFAALLGSQKAGSEERTAFTLTEMADKGRLRAIARLFPISFPRSQCRLQ
jgi:hypothetical protein